VNDSHLGRKHNFKPVVWGRTNSGGGREHFTNVSRHGKGFGSSRERPNPKGNKAIASRKMLLTKDDEDTLPENRAI